MHSREEKKEAFGRLLDIMDALRERCPWNAEQTMESIRPMTEEEVYELSDAIIRADSADICKEIGDLLYHLVFYARIAQEKGQFDIADSIMKVCGKMEFRHPHVFRPDGSLVPEGEAPSAKEIADTWELVKAKEKDGNRTVMGEASQEKVQKHYALHAAQGLELGGSRQVCQNHGNGFQTALCPQQAVPA